MTLQDEVRAAQSAEFDGKEGSEEAKAATLALYDAVDALSPEQRSLLVMECSVKIKSAVTTLAKDPENGIAIAMGTHVLIALVGYVTALGREAEGYTSTGDRKVDAVIESVHDCVTANVLSLMDPDTREKAVAAKAALDARIEAGEDPQAVYDELVGASGHVHTVNAAAPAAVKEEVSTGLYL